jgi:regulatory protein
MQRRKPPDDPKREKPVPRPGVVTNLSVQARDTERASVFVDGAFAFGLALSVVEREGLHVGQTLTQDDLDRLLEAEAYHRALNAALHFLSYRPRAEGEIRQRLRRSDTPDDVIDQVLVQLREWNYVNDVDFAQRWIENRSQHRPRGSRLLAQELRAKGVAPEVVSQSLEAADLDESAQALEVGQKRWEQLAALEPVVRERRLIGFLQRRGFSFDSIRHVLDALQRGQQDESDA